MFAVKFKADSLKKSVESFLRFRIEIKNSNISGSSGINLFFVKPGGGQIFIICQCKGGC